MRTINICKFNLSLPLWLHWRVLQALLAYSDPTDRKNHFQITLSASSCKYQKNKTSFNWLGRVDPNNFPENGIDEKRHTSLLEITVVFKWPGLNLIFTLCNFCIVPQSKTFQNPKMLFWTVLMISKYVYHKDQTIPTNVNILFNPLWKRIKLVEDLLLFNSISSVFWIEICRSGTELHLIKIIDVFWRSKLFKIKFIDHFYRTQVRS